MKEELPDAQKCHAYNTLRKVGCTRDDGHSGAHLHHYENGNVCGWGIAGPATVEGDAR